jgi:hypothetical protein
LVLRKKRPSPKSIAAKQFLRAILAKGPKPVEDILKAAHENGVNPHTLTQLSQGIVSKKPVRGADGVRRSYWTLCSSPPYVNETPEAARRNAAAYSAGYEAAVADMQWRLASISATVIDGKSKEICMRLNERLNELKHSNR